MKRKWTGTNDGIVLEKIKCLPEGVIEDSPRSSLLEFGTHHRFYKQPETGQEFISIIADTESNQWLIENDLPDAGIYQIVIPAGLREKVREGFEIDGEYTAE